VNGSDSTAGLKRNLEKDDNKIVVTTIQKLNNLMKSEGDLPIYGKQVVFIFDECHRSQFGEAQKNLKKKFKRFYQFGFTGTPIFPENALGADTTASVFGRELHSYVITDAIRDEKVLKFKVDYNDVRPQFKAIETEQDEKKLSAAENKQALLHPDRIREISQYILNNFRQKTHRLQAVAKGFNAMFAVSSVDAAKLYYESFRELQKNSDKPLRVATIFSFAANEEQDAIGDIADESFDVSAMNSSAKEFLSAAITDYNALFKTNFSVDSNGFQNYYRDLAKQVKAKEIDLLIVVGMFLTGFDAPTLNTLFVDKNLRYHGLMQAYSRTNRIFDATKSFGNIVTFRDLEQATIDAITLFGDKNTKNVVLEKSYKEYMEGFTDAVTGEARRGFMDVARELEARFPDPAAIETEADKKAFATLFVDKNLRYHGLMQAYSRTNRIFDATKSFGNIVTFRDLEQATIDAITLFGDKNTKNVVLEKSYKEYMEGFTDAVTGEARRGFVEVVKELEQRFPDPAAIEKEADKKAFAKLFGEYLRVENVLQNYDEFASLKELQGVDLADPAAVEAFKAKHYLSDDDLASLQAITLPAERKVQDYRSTYNDVRDWLRREKAGAEQDKSTIDWDDVVFEVDLLKSQEINLDYILELIFEHNKKTRSKAELVDEVRRVIRASLGNRAKESLLIDFINQTDLDRIGDKASVIETFFSFAQAEQRLEAQELIEAESLNVEAARRYIASSLKREFVSENGTELNAILPKMSPLNPQYLSKKQSVFQKIAAFVEKFKGVGGQI
jgi:type I site-specific restriction-modification system R (restriction) subunit